MWTPRLFRPTSATNLTRQACPDGWGINPGQGQAPSCGMERAFVQFCRSWTTSFAKSNSTLPLPTWCCAQTHCPSKGGRGIDKRPAIISIFPQTNWWGWIKQQKKSELWRWGVLDCYRSCCKKLHTLSLWPVWALPTGNACTDLVVNLVVIDCVDRWWLHWLWQCSLPRSRNSLRTNQNHRRWGWQG